MDIRVARVLAPNPSVYTLEGTNTWVVGRDLAVVIDPGPDEPAHVDAVIAAAGPIGVILLTHGHEDHADGAERLSRLTGAPIWAGDPTIGSPVRDGQRIDLGGTALEAIYAPGHTPDHFIFRLPQTGAMFTGDAILGRGTSLIDPPEGDLVAYLDTLERLRRVGPKTLFPGHGPTIFAGALKVQDYLDHRAERETQIMDALASERSIVDLVLEIYADYPVSAQPLAARTVLAHLLKLEHEGRVEKVSVGGVDRYRVPEERSCTRCARPVKGKATLCPRCSMDALQERPAFE